MKQERAFEILLKLMSKMNYNDRKNREYAGGLHKSYNRARNLLTTEPIFEKTQRPVTREEIEQINCILADHKETTYEHLTKYLFDHFISKKYPAGEEDIEDTVVYYLGCLRGIEAALAIINQIETEE